MNESYTSSKCPRCHNWVKSKSMRVKYCSGCDIHYHRDVMAAENMIHIAISILKTGERPADLPKWSPKKQDNHHHHHQDINQDINHQDQYFNHQGTRGIKRKCVTLLK